MTLHYEILSKNGEVLTRYNHPDGELKQFVLKKPTSYKVARLPTDISIHELLAMQPSSFLDGLSDPELTALELCRGTGVMITAPDAFPYYQWVIVFPFVTWEGWPMAMSLPSTGGTQHVANCIKAVVECFPAKDTEGKYTGGHTKIREALAKVPMTDWVRCRIKCSWE